MASSTCGFVGPLLSGGEFLPETPRLRAGASGELDTAAAERRVLAGSVRLPRVGAKTERDPQSGQPSEGQGAQGRFQKAAPGV